MQKLLQTLPNIGSSRVARVALWLVGEYCTDAQEVAMAMTTLKACLGDLPFVLLSEDEAANGTPTPTSALASTPIGRPVVLADGTYGHQSAIEDAGASAAPLGAVGLDVSASLKIRSLLVGGDFFLATVVATCLTKLTLRTRTHLPVRSVNLVAADAMLILAGLLRLGQPAKGGGMTSSLGPHSMDADSQERISIYIRVLSDPTEAMQELCLVHCREAYSTMLTERLASDAAHAPAAHVLPDVNRQADDLISVRQLKGRSAVVHGAVELDDDDDDVLSKATGALVVEDFSQRLKRVTQLTGLSDPVYAEAYVTVHSYDILLDLLIMNQTPEPMHNLCLELATVGDLKLCERPQAYSLSPGEAKHVKANIKVSSTETGIVFGSIVYDSPLAVASGASNAPTESRNCVVLNDIHIDIMDYIAPASCSDLAFRAMWAEFEWENKVAINTDIIDVAAFLEHVLKTTNMRCLTPPSALEGDSGFLAANLYAKSIFGKAITPMREPKLWPLCCACIVSRTGPKGRAQLL